MTTIDKLAEIHKQQSKAPIYSRLDKKLSDRSLRKVYPEGRSMKVFLRLRNLNPPIFIRRQRLLPNYNRAKAKGIIPIPFSEPR